MKEEQQFSLVKSFNKNLREEVVEKTNFVKKFFELPEDYRVTISTEEFIGKSSELRELEKENEEIKIAFLDVPEFSTYGYEVSVSKSRNKNSLKATLKDEYITNGGILKVSAFGSDFYNITVVHQNDKTEVQYNVWLVSEKQLELFGKFLKTYKEFFVKKQAAEKHVEVYGGENYTVSNFLYSWDDIILEPAVKKSIMESISFWYSNEDWYRERKFPYKRGVLIYGYPGNGKTFLSKIIISQYDLNIVQFNFGNTSLQNQDLVRAFKTARENAPSLFLLEDVDRVFSKHEKQVSAVTKDCLFNCLDGIEELDGVLVIATANHPEDIDSALINRPSRFDTIIELTNPSEELRFEYLKKLFSKDFDDDTFLREVAKKSNEMSMAFMKEIYFKSVILALSKQETMGKEHVKEAFEQCKGQFLSAKTKKSEHKTGFGAVPSKNTDWD